ATKRFIPAPRKSCGNHIARITSSAAFSHSQGHKPSMMTKLGDFRLALGSCNSRAPVLKEKLVAARPSGKTARSV
ncbi:hypothetical protein, partial [Bradyrhizobium sp. IAR9]|uniref:hypothetical protein n=1 Tax=Bradyrhizobium sp. IAR9 TaxID=2663841 RepID=UPI001AED43DF